VLLTAPAGSAWRGAADRLEGPRVANAVIGDEIREEDGGDWLAAYGLREDGAVLVRPDGHVAWRSPSGADDPKAALQEVMNAILCRGAAAPGSAA
jgi:putative polyketide hydroxylase